MRKDYYAILGVQKNATDDEIKKAYRKLSKQYHPDVCKEEGAAEKFSDISEAYNVLSNKDTRTKYDLGENNMFGSDGGFDFDGGFSSAFGRAFYHFTHGGEFNSETMDRGRDLKITVNVDFDDLFRPIHKSIRIKRKNVCHRCNGSGSADNEYDTCPECGGSGRTRVDGPFGGWFKTCERCHGTGKIPKNPCPECGGSGVKSDYANVEFDIPAGMFDGSSFVLPGQGDAGEIRGAKGNLIVTVNVNPNKDGITRDSYNNLLYTAYIPYSVMVLGGTVEVPYLHGTKHKITIPAGTQCGKVFRVPGKGFKNPMSNETYDYLITAYCDIPDSKKLRDSELHLIEHLKEEQTK